MIFSFRVERRIARAAAPTCSSGSTCSAAGRAGIFGPSNRPGRKALEGPVDDGDGGVVQAPRWPGVERDERAVWLERAGSSPAIPLFMEVGQEKHVGR